MGAFANILEDQLFTDSVSVSIHSLSLSSLAVSNPSGIAFCLSPSMSQNQSTFQINSLITACSFQNMTSCQFSSSFKPKLQSVRLIDSTMENVENGLYGTVIPEIRQHKEFSCTNCSIVECTNTENDGSTKEIEEDRTFTSSAQQIKIDPTFSHYSFTSCTFTATNTTTSFTLIYLNPLEGNVRFSLCTFKVEIESNHNTLIDCTANRDLNVDCVIDTCTFTFWRESAVSTSLNQLSLSSFLHVFLVSSTFSLPSDSESDTPRISSARTVTLQNSVTFLFTSNCIFRRQTTSANGGVFYVPSSIPLHRLPFETCQADRNGGSCYATMSYLVFARCVFRRNKANLGGALRLDYLRTILLIDCHFGERGSRDLGYYYSATNNGNMTTEDSLFQSPSAVTPPTNELFVEDGESGDCSGDRPCGSLGAALSETGSGTNLINVGSGSFAVPVTSISSNVGLFGVGFLTNTSTFTAVKQPALSFSVLSSSLPTLRTSLSPIMGNDFAHSGFPSANINTISACRSTSTLPHALVDLSILLGEESTILAIRFDQAVPLSWFKGFQNEIDDMMESTTQVLIRSISQLILDPFEIVRKNVAIHSCPLTIQTYERTLVHVGNGATVPILMEEDANLLRLSNMKISLSSNQQHPFIQCRGGQLQIDAMTLQPATVITSIATSPFSNLETNGDGAVLHAVNTTVTCSDSSFAKCTARNGGALFVELDGSKYVRITPRRDQRFRRHSRIAVRGRGRQVESGRKGRSVVCDRQVDIVQTNPLQQHRHEPRSI
ncbi:hypothetical protein BLNAU_14096 [Blattamonas nauphoetae]|uniref:Uncharacterized protein n=1 Tax=Blattamonas nauphoetae TaxID=2049346 RepID=A0ABQ9XI34_9EUKA|nr:hypothetical protein BLNAU_14096 [Blattamonas nauphoetae]